MLKLGNRWTRLGKGRPIRDFPNNPIRDAGDLD
jgi:hypothetical protein